MMDNNTKENRLRIYKAALEYGKQHNRSGFCCWISSVLESLGLESMPDPYFHGPEFYEELAPYKPEEPCTIWFPYNLKGLETRFKILETIISEMESELNN